MMAFGEKQSLDEIEARWEQVFLQKRFEEALQIMLAAYQAEPNNSYYCTKLACTYMELQDYEQALIYFRKAVDLDPENPCKVTNLGLCFFELQDFDSAVSVYQRAIQLTPTEEFDKLSELYSYLGCSLIKLDQMEKACESHARAIALTLECLEDSPEHEECLERIHYYQSNRQYQVIAQAFAESVKYKRPKCL